MKCENFFCIYQENDECILDEISIDITGACGSCIYIDIPISDLNKYKTTLRNKIENY